MPPRKTSQPPPYVRASRSSPIRRKQLQLGGLILCGVILIMFFGSTLFKPGKERAPTGTPEVVVVTFLDDAIMSPEYRQKVMENRRYYAEKQGYGVFFPNASDYDLNNSPRTWTLVPGTRHAMAAFPHSTYFFSLSPHALIMDPSVNLEEHLVGKKKLESLMLRDKPVVPPDSVIKTFAHLKGDKIDFIVTQDNEGLCQGSFVIRRGEWAKFFLDTWFDPLYRSYNFQKAEGHALEHIVQWHPTILTKLALVPLRILNTYNVDIATRGGQDVMYKRGDFLVRLETRDELGKLANVVQILMNEV
ncbi:uncharacterized protein KY384_004260 [Bacidia gigantensis]|uniref:uncharacterized protein n=1 Tax=Bacidia gigantensis TaxID=2732470 RepID=UPI001D0499B5|nr:uncharacterized protein KY384_004260 [Bacidia gigantensis]KAG8530903.1 hypothetical protein KY384_004260 [Bacidia gigantensis]